jgi:hypothetical protein
MSEHTPGPLSVLGKVSCRELENIYEVGDGSGLVTTAYVPRLADAVLYAAAPALLAFAEYVLEMDRDNPAPLFERARAAIAQATGEKQ